MIEFEIDGKKITAEPGKMVIEVADNHNIYIPRFCYHKKLSIAANCRMCLVEVEKAPKALPACATPVAAGMKVFTKSPKAVAAQRSVMEFLLINHPLDCPICDQGGECELQDLSMGYGADASRYNQPKRSVHDKNMGPLISTEMTRCIQCTRCVRFGDEVAGMREIGAYNRGEHLEIGTYIERTVKSEMSGNVIDICPVGALTSKPFRFTARAWEMQQYAGIAAHDCIGSHIYWHTRGKEYSPTREVMRVVPRHSEAVNEVWLSDRDRFSYTGLYNADRVTSPKIKNNNQWQEINWETALERVAERLQKIEKNSIGAIASPNSTTEEFYLLQKIMRQLGSPHMDHRIRQSDFSDQSYAPGYPHLGIGLQEIEKLDGILLIGSNVRCEQPLGSHRIRKASLKNAKIMCVNPVDYVFNFKVSEKMIVGTELLPRALAQIANVLIKDATDVPSSIKKMCHDVAGDKHATAIANQLKRAEKKAIFLGAHAVNHPHAAIMRVLAQWIAAQTGASFGVFSEGANSAGAWLAGAVPHRGSAAQTVDKSGLDVVGMLKKSLKAYLLWGVEPEYDFSHSLLARDAFKKAELVVCFTAFSNPVMEEYADVILPITPISETAGTFVNVEGRWQSFHSASQPREQARPGWRVLRVLANILGFSDFAYESTHEILQELQDRVAKMPVVESSREISQELPVPTEKLMRIAEWPMYCIDSLVRRAKPLQEMPEGAKAVIRINSELAKRLQFKAEQKVTAVQNKNRITLPIFIDDRVADNNVLIAAGISETIGFDAVVGEIELKRS